VVIPVEAVAAMVKELLSDDDLLPVRDVGVVTFSVTVQEMSSGHRHGSIGGRERSN